MAENLCTRCGKPRVTKKKWTETITTFYGVSKIRHEETACPDPACQKKVDTELAAARQKKLEIQQSRDKRIEQNKNARVGIRL